MKRMVGITGRLADRAGLLSRTEDALEQADLPLRPPEALFFYFAGLFVVAHARPARAPVPMALVLVAGSPASCRSVMLHRRRAKRLREFQIAAARHAQPARRARCGPASRSPRASSRWRTRRPSRPGASSSGCSPESRLGRPIEDALEDSANRMTSVDLMWAVMAIRIQREVGGNLAELLDTVADTMTQRERMRREIKALTAEGRFSGWILGIFPIVFAGRALPGPARLHRRCCSTNRSGSWPCIACGGHDLHRLHLAPQDPGDRGVT